MELRHLLLLVDLQQESGLFLLELFDPLSTLLQAKLEGLNFGVKSCHISASFHKLSFDHSLGGRLDAPRIHT